jgi:hypothetical protein
MEKAETRGRKPGRTFPHKRSVYLDDEGLGLLDRLAAVKLGDKPRGESGAIREALRQLAQREGVE